jgi:hypothetical protein
MIDAGSRAYIDVDVNLVRRTQDLRSR